MNDQLLELLSVVDEEDDEDDDEEDEDEDEDDDDEEARWRTTVQRAMASTASATCRAPICTKAAPEDRERGVAVYLKAPCVRRSARGERDDPEGEDDARREDP